MKKSKLYALTETALMVALAAVLSVCKIYKAPLGGAVTLFSILPIVYISFKHGVVWGLGGGFVYSVTQLLFDLGDLSVIPTTIGFVGGVVFDFLLPFTLLGLAGVVQGRKKSGAKKRNPYVTVFMGTLLAVLLRFMCHLFSGAVIWYELTKAGDWNEYVHKYGMWTYSFIYNIIYLGPDGALALLGSTALVRLLKLPFFGAKNLGGGA